MHPFTYTRAQSLDDVPNAMRQDTQPHFATPQFLAGGTTLLDLMKLDVMRPAAVLDIKAIGADLARIVVQDDGVQLGALVRMADAAEHPAIREQYPVISQSLQQAASQQIRNMATLGGNVLQRTRCNYFRDTSYGSLQQT